MHHNAELGFAGFAAVVRGVFRLLTVEIGEHLVAIADGDRGIGLLAIAHEAETNGGARTAAGNFVYQVVAILDGAAIDRGDDVAGLDASFVGGTAGLHLLDQYAILEAVNAVDRAGEIRRGTECRSSRGSPCGWG